MAEEKRWIVTYEVKVAGADFTAQDAIELAGMVLVDPLVDPSTDAIKVEARPADQAPMVAVCIIESLDGGWEDVITVHANEKAARAYVLRFVREAYECEDPVPEDWDDDRLLEWGKGWCNVTIEERAING